MVAERSKEASYEQSRDGELPESSVKLPVYSGELPKELQRACGDPEEILRRVAEKSSKELRRKQKEV